VSGGQIRYALELFPKWFSGKHWYHGKYRDVDIDMFDVVEQESETKLNDDGKLRTYRRTVRNETVMLLPICDVPEFRLVPRNWLGRIMPGLSVRGMRFEPATESDAQAIERFQRRWSILPGRIDAAVGLPNSEQELNETAVRNLFSPMLMDCVRPWAKLAARVYRDCLLVSRSAVLPPESLRELMDDGVELRMNLLSARRRVAEHADKPVAVAGQSAHITAK
jgi:hypothetical protein